jgi:hypothetical protein
MKPAPPVISIRITLNFRLLYDDRSESTTEYTGRRLYFPVPAVACSDRLTMGRGCVQAPSTLRIKATIDVRI